MTNRKNIDWGDDAGFTGPQHYFRESLIIRTINKLKPNGRILDVGCGGGNVLIRLGGIGYDTIGIDKSQRAIDFLKKTTKRFGLSKKIHAIVGSIESLPFPNDSFSVVIAGEILEHIHNDVAALKEIYRVLKPGGFVVVTVPAHSLKYGEMDTLAGHVRRYDKEELEIKITKTELQVSELYYWGFPLTNLWQQHILLPLVKNRLSGSRNTHIRTEDILIPEWITRIVSAVFSIDLLCKKTSLGDCLFAVAVKKKR